MSETTEMVSVAAMLRATGENTAEFMKQVAMHVEKLEAEVTRLSDRIHELESAQNESK